MRICVVGAGSIGGLLGARLAAAGQDVTLIARGDHLDAIRDRGLELVLADGSSQVIKQLAATDDFAQPGEQDVVIVAVKAHQLADVARPMQSLYGTETVVVPVQNGIPWWYFHSHGGPLNGHRLESLDPDGEIERHIPTERVISCIAYPAAVRSAPGVITHVEGDRVPVGEPDGSKSDRAHELAAALGGAGFKSRILSDIRSHIWLKAWGNLSFNPISALTRATLSEIVRYEPTRALAAEMMREAQAIAVALDVRVRVSIDQRIEGAAQVGEHKTSMLQDVEAGKPLEVDALVGVFSELGRLTETPTPSIDAVLACVRLLAAKAR